MEHIYKLDRQIYIRYKNYILPEVDNGKIYYKRWSSP